MKRMLAWFALLMVALTGLTLAGLATFWPQLEAWRFDPRVPFKPLPALAANAYAAPAMWLARPDLATDPARYLPPGQTHERKGAAYVFFLHPTTYLSRKSWNAPLDDSASNTRAALSVRRMATVFNDEAAIYAPRYRQAAWGTFLVNRPEQQQALGIAQGDARLALATFLRAVPPDAPIVLAGDGQGALILMRLIRDVLASSPQSAQVIAVYLAGWPVSPGHDLAPMGMGACTRADQTHCVMAWTTFAQPGDPREATAMARRYPALDGHGRDDVRLCTNPLNGGAAAEAPAAANLGSLSLGDERRRAALVHPSAGARCDPSTGLLMVTDPPHLGDDIGPGNDYAHYDFALFWRNLRGDVARRETAWLRAHPATERKYPA